MPDCQRCLYTLKALCSACLTECMWYKVWFVNVMGKALKQPVLTTDQCSQNITYLDDSYDVEISCLIVFVAKEFKFDH